MLKFEYICAKNSFVIKSIQITIVNIKRIFDNKHVIKGIRYISMHSIVKKIKLIYYL